VGKGRVRRELRADVAQPVEGRMMGREPPASTSWQLCNLFSSSNADARNKTATELAVAAFPLLRV
jgi:hypothetical protein